MAKFMGRRAFTLIELLTVIAIIALLAGLVVGLGGKATEANRAGRVKAEHQRLVTAIESYKAEVGSYPPDNINTTGSFTDYRQRIARNSLFYELSGCIFTNNASGGSFVVVGKPDEVITTADLKANFGADGVQNSGRRVGEVPYRGVQFKPNQYSDIQPASGSGDVDALIVPVQGPKDIELTAPDGKKKVNPWLYDASTTNRHNLETFDLWAEYLGKKRTNIVGNWKE